MWKHSSKWSIASFDDRGTIIGYMVSMCFGGEFRELALELMWDMLLGWNVLESVVGIKQTHTNTLARKAGSLFTDQSEVIAITYICVCIYMQ